MSINSLTTIPNISKLVNLENINWNYNNLVALPELSSFKRLNSLVAHDNDLTSLPDISKNDSLTELNLNTNQLKTVPNLSNLVRLQKLSLHNNQISKLLGVDNLDSLKEFTCYNNQLGNFPLLDQLLKIQIFNASKNQLTFAPDFGKNSKIPANAKVITASPTISSNTSVFLDIFIVGTVYQKNTIISTMGLNCG